MIGVSGENIDRLSVATTGTIFGAEEGGLSRKLKSSSSASSSSTAGVVDIFGRVGGSGGGGGNGASRGCSLRRDKFMMLDVLFGRLRRRCWFCLDTDEAIVALRANPFLVVGCAAYCVCARFSLLLSSWIGVTALPW